MRKSERIRLLELQIVRLETTLELYGQILSNIIELQEMQEPVNLDAGKWYKAKTEQE
jgi:hypothetical protein